MKHKTKNTRSRRKSTARGKTHSHRHPAARDERVLVQASANDDIPGQQTGPANPQELWRAGLETFASWAGNLVPIASRQVQQTTRLLATSTRESAELFRKMVDAGQAFSADEIQSRWTEWWTLSVRALQSNAEMVTQVGLRTIDAWMSMIRNNAAAQESSS